MEVAAQWRSFSGWHLIAAYTRNDQFYTEYVEQLSAGTLTRRFNRVDNKIPGISPNEAAVRLGYDQRFGPWRGLGGFVEYVWKDTFFMENANLLKAPGYGLVNLNLHYDREIAYGYVQGVVVFFEIKNVFDKTYVASASNISDSINAATGLQNAASVLAQTATGSIYAGTLRAYLAGMKLAFR